MAKGRETCTLSSIKQDTSILMPIRQTHKCKNASLIRAILFESIIFQTRSSAYFSTANVRGAPSVKRGS